MWLHSMTVGLLGCLVAVIGFGTQGIFVKSKKVLEADIHPVLIAFLYSFCIAIIGCIIALVAYTQGYKISDDWYRASYAAIAFAPGNLFLLWSCRRLGVGFAVGVVASTATISSFIIGTVSGDSFHPTTQLPGVLLMVIGTVMISATKIPVFEDWIDPIPQHLLVEVLGESPDAMHHMNQIIPAFNQNLQTPLINEDRSLSSEALAAAYLADNNKNNNPKSSLLPRVQNPISRPSDTSDTSEEGGRWSRDSGLTSLGAGSDDGGSLVIRRTDPGPVRSPHQHQKLLGSSRLNDGGGGSDIDGSDDVDHSNVGHSKYGGGTLFLSPSGASLLEHRLRRKKNRQLRKSLSQTSDTSITLSTSSSYLRPESRSAFVAAVVEATQNLDLDMDWIGFVLAFLAGIFLGIQGVLFSNVITFENLANQLAVFLISQYIFTFIILFPSLIFGNLFISKINSPILFSLRYAFLGSICFCFAVTGQIIAVLNIPVNVAIPLTQLNIIVAGLWSVLYFKEVESPRLIFVFSCAMIVDLAGAVLMALKKF